MDGYYVHIHSGARVSAVRIGSRGRWPVYGSSTVKNSATGAMEQPTEEVFPGDWEVTWGATKWIVPRLAFDLCYVRADEMTGAEVS